MSQNLPRPVEDFKEAYADAWQAFAQLGSLCHEAGPLDEKARRLVKVALAIGAGLEGGTHSAVRNALAAGVSPDEVKHVAVLGVTTIGFPAAVRALTWIRDCVEAAE